MTVRGVTLTYPKSSRKLVCVTWDGCRMLSHHLKDGDTLNICDERYCQNMICSEHLANHQQEHMLRNLGG